jgi:RNA polymerase sigma-70 factor (ECF subfamily)
MSESQRSALASNAPAPSSSPSPGTSPAEPRARIEPAAEGKLDEHALRALLGAVARGDHQAMARLFDATHRLVFVLARRILGANDAAEEVMLDVYLQVWRSAPSFDCARGRVSSWLLTIARSRALDRRRSLAARAVREQGWSDALAENTADCTCSVDPQRAQDRAERRDSVRAAIGALPDAQRLAIELAYFPGLSHTEIAARLGEPLGTIKTRIRLGMIKLRDLLQALEGEQ